MSPILVAISPHSVNKDIEQGKKVLEFLEQGYKAREKCSRVLDHRGVESLPK